MFKHYPFHHASYVKDEGVTIDLKAMTITLKAIMSCESLGLEGWKHTKGGQLEHFCDMYQNNTPLECVAFNFG